MKLDLNFDKASLGTRVKDLKDQARSLDRKTLVLGAGGLVGILVAVNLVSSYFGSGNAPAAVAPSRPPAPVDVSKVQRGPLALRIDTVGNVQPIASVALKTRIDATIATIAVPDGAQVKAGDVLVRFDDRQIQAQVKGAEATLAKDKAALEQSQRDFQRTSELLAKGSGTQLSVDNNRTLVATTKAQVLADEANLDNLKVQLGWHTISAPISGRIGVLNAKVGSILRAGDNTTTGTLTTIVQTSPIYVSFAIPQVYLADLRETLAQTGGPGAEVIARPQGSKQSAKGKIVVIDNTIDPATGTINVRAMFENADDLLWPGQLCDVRVVVRTDPEVVTIPRAATQSGQMGNFVYVVKDGKARLQPIKLARTQDAVDVVAEGLNGGETIVTNGALLLTTGASVAIKSSSDATAANAKE